MTRTRSHRPRVHSGQPVMWEGRRRLVVAIVVAPRASVYVSADGALPAEPVPPDSWAAAHWDGTAWIVPTPGPPAAA